jgi:superfamily II DNA or RNA helicase
MRGRALRHAPGKERALILDHAGNVWRHGRDVTRHWRRRSSAFVYSAGKWAASRIAM